MKRFGCLTVSAMGLFLAACGGKPVPADGYADIKYGMSPSELTRLGYKCDPEPDGICLNAKTPARPDAQSGFATPDGVLIIMREGRAAQTEVTFRTTTEDETIAAYTRAYGRPKVCDDEHVWSAASGATITVRKTVAPGATGAAAKGSWATYRSPEVSAADKVGRC